MIGDGGQERDLSGFMVPRSGRLIATGDRYEPYRLIDAAGEPVAAVAEFFRDLQAAGRSEATLRSYGMDLLRWFRFLWADSDVGWEPATASRPATSAGGCWWRASVPARTGAAQARGHVRRAGKPYAASVRAHCETVLRASTSSTWRGQRADRQPVPAGSVAAGRPGARASQPDGAVPQRAAAGSTGRGCRPGFRAASPTRSSTRSSPGCPRTGTGRWSPSTSRPVPARRSCCRPRWPESIRAGR